MARLSGLGQLPQRLVLGRPVRNRAGESMLSTRLALPSFASGALSSVACATQEVLIILPAGVCGGPLVGQRAAQPERDGCAAARSSSPA